MFSHSKILFLVLLLFVTSIPSNNSTSSIPIGNVCILTCSLLEEKAVTKPIQIKQTWCHSTPYELLYSMPPEQILSSLWLWNYSAFKLECE